MTARTDRPSYWLAETHAPSCPPLEADAEADVLVVGAGITGLTAAYLLGREGADVLVLDRHGVATAETGHTTAHAAPLPDKRLRDLVRAHGETGAKAVWDAGAFAVDLIAEIARDEGVACDFERVDGYLYGPRAEDPELLAEEARLARRLGHAAEPADPEDVPFDARAANRYPDQARFHPLKYLRGLLEPLDAFGVRVHGNTEVRDVHPRGGGGPRPVVARTAGGHVVRARHVVAASHVPFMDRFRMWSKLYPYRSYVIGARVAKGRVPDALYWDTLTPYHYTRIQPEEDHDVVIFGGEDHRTGHARDPRDAHARLATALRDAVHENVDVTWAWSAQDVETVDGLPFIGVNPGSPGTELIATGYGGNGMTFGTLAGWMLAERVLGRRTRWDALLDPSRKPVREARTFAGENVTYPRQLVKGFLTRKHGPAPWQLAPGEGTVISHGTRKVAVSRDAETGAFHVVNAVCPHMACVVNWNASEGSWDCPCHGSRFTVDGRVMNGPAAEPLHPVPPEEAGVPPEGERAPSPGADGGS